MTADLFDFADEHPAGAPSAAQRPKLGRPSRDDLESRRFSARVADMLTIARAKDDPAAAARAVRKKLADAEGLDVSEQEIAAINHRYWERMGRRPVPTFAEAMKHAATFWWVP